MSLVAPEMVSVSAGSIVLRDARTKTSRTASLRAFRIGAYPVTWRLYSQVREQHVPEAVDPDAPVHSLSWLDAVDWCNSLSARAGLDPVYDVRGGDVSWDVGADGFRLPTEAEWEWACRAGTTGPRYGPLSQIAWSDDDAVTSAQRVGQKRPNEFGAYDMLGNVWEWCWDYADPARYGDYRALRGGGWADQHWSVRASVRRGSMPGARRDDIGFRLAQGAAGDNGDHAGQGWSRQADVDRARTRGARPVGWTPLRT